MPTLVVGTSSSTDLLPNLGALMLLNDKINSGGGPLVAFPLRITESPEMIDLIKAKPAFGNEVMRKKQQNFCHKTYIWAIKCKLSLEHSSIV